MSYQPRFNIVLYQPEIPPNTGAVGRTCVALEAKLWLVRPLGFRIDSATLRRAGLDYWQYLQWQTVDHWQQLTELLDAEQCWFFTKNAQRVYTEVEFRTGDALIFGAETSGLPPSILQTAPEKNLRIPCGPHVRSLNLSCSVAVAGFELDRQLRQRGG